MFDLNEREASRKPSMKENLRRFCSKGFLYLVTLTPQEVYFSSMACVFTIDIDKFSINAKLFLKDLLK